MGTLDGRVIIITGGARGMGASHARHLVAEGARVVIGDVIDDAGEILAKELGDDAVFVHQDVTSAADWDAVVATATETFGAVHGLVNNAGVLSFGSLADTTPEAFQRMMDINVTGTFLGLRAVAPVITEAGGGSIVNISSINGLLGTAFTTAYTASKFAVRGLTKAAAQELGPAGIRVNSVHPGGIATPMTQHEGGDAAGAAFAKFPIPRWGQPEEVSPLVAFLLSDQSSYSTGGEFVVDGGITSGLYFS